MSNEKIWGVIGLSRTGLSVLMYLLERGAHVIAMDDNHDVIQSITARDELKPYIEQRTLIIADKDSTSYFIDYLIPSPGIPPKRYQHYIERGSTIISDLDLLYYRSPDACYIGITGTNGKSTTSSLVAHMLTASSATDSSSHTALQHHQPKVALGGNIGVPALNLPELQSYDDSYVLEASSFQLETSNSIHFDIAACINIAPDHLDRHGTMAEYVEAKKRIFNISGSNDNSTRFAFLQLSRSLSEASSSLLDTLANAALKDCSIAKDEQQALSKSISASNLLVQQNPISQPFETSITHALHLRQTSASQSDDGITAVASTTSDLYNSTAPQLRQRQTAIISVDYPETQKIYQEITTEGRDVIPVSITRILPQGVSAIDQTVYINQCLGHEQSVFELPYNRSLLGSHNRENIAIAVAITLARGLSIPAIIQTLTTFVGLPHRLELVHETDYAVFINDSKATNTNSAAQALSCLSSPIYWIVGGRSKEAEGITPLQPFYSKIAKAYLIGESTDSFHSSLTAHKIPCEKCYTLSNAIEKVLGSLPTTPSNDKATVLLSPACSSLDQWGNFEERGNFFRNAIQQHFQSNT